MYKQKISPCLWFDDKAEEAVNFYVRVFSGSPSKQKGICQVLDVAHYDEASAAVSGRPIGSVQTVDFELDGQHFIALNGGPIFKFSEAISLVVHCQTQEEVDYFWEMLSADPKFEQCGWLKDKYGLTWQVVPDVLVKFLNDPDKVKASRVMQAMLKMKKLDIAGLQNAHNQV